MTAVEMTVATNEATNGLAAGESQPLLPVIMPKAQRPRKLRRAAEYKKVVGKKMRRAQAADCDSENVPLMSNSSQAAASSDCDQSPQRPRRLSLGSNSSAS